MKKNTLIARNGVSVSAAALLLALLPVPPVHSQDYQITSSNFGGGGSSSGGGYSVTGSVKTTSTGSPTGGAYSVTSGFLAGVVVLQTPSAPRISLMREAGGLKLLWTSADSGWVLQVSSGIGRNANWANASENVTVNDTLRSAILNSATGVRFYRLPRASQ